MNSDASLKYFFSNTFGQKFPKIFGNFDFVVTAAQNIKIMEAYQEIFRMIYIGLHFYSQVIVKLNYICQTKFSKSFELSSLNNGVFIRYKIQFIEILI